MDTRKISKNFVPNQSFFIPESRLRASDQFKSSLKTLVVQQLKTGNTSASVLQSIQFLHHTGDFSMSPQEVYTLAEMLFKADSQVTREVAFCMAKNAPTYDAPYWLNAARHSETHLRDLIRIYRQKIHQAHHHNGAQQEFSDYMFIAHPAVINFGWELAERYLRTKEVREIWGKLIRNRKENAWQLLQLNIQAPSAVQWFVASHNNQMAHLYTYSPEKIAFIIKKGAPPVRHLLLGQITQSFECNPLMFLCLVSNLAHQQRTQLLYKCLPQFAQQTLSIDEGFLAHTIQRLGESAWGLKALLTIVAHAQVTQAETDQVVGLMLEEAHSAQVLMQCLAALLDTKNKALFVKALGQNPDKLLAYSQYIPQQTWVDLLRQMPATYLPDIKQVFAQAMPTLGDEILNITAPLFEDTLIDWLECHQAKIQAPLDAPKLLYKICIHPLPKVRQWGHIQALRQGLKADFALKLLESGLPETVNFAKTYFDSITIEDSHFVDNLLTLCDSPITTTRNYGLALLQKIEVNSTKEALLLAYLTEHADAKIQTGVAQKLLQTSPSLSQAPFVKKNDQAALCRKISTRWPVKM
ncbi:hypothetical protein [uncultured Microscilla sp.]|uniref:hypothetical protein n=1 Tax=uncultured Microscilla sp. TaxID=432653 RepID=UPI00260935A5|nr:hypothetical protein [uncultured Microscilla sp.]